MKKLCAVLAFTIILSTSAMAGEYQKAGREHTENTEYHWYFQKNKEHKQPDLPAEFGFIEENSGIYLNHEVKEGDKVIYLTFDAGYENGNVEKILDALDRHGAKGAFFILSNLIERNTALVKRMAEEGHLVCNHTADHRNMAKVRDREEFQKELNKLNEIMKEKCGCGLAPFYRPPEGSFSESNLKNAADMGYQTVFWSYAYADWDNNRQPDQAASAAKILAHTHNGEVILLHPTSATNAAIMDELLTAWEKEGYRFGSLYEFQKIS